MTRAHWQRQLTGQSLIALVALLPVLVAGLGIGEPAAPGEWERLAAAAAGTRSTAASLVADSFLLATAPPGPMPTVAGSDAALTALAGARLAQLLGVAGVSFLGYLAVTMAGSRARALLAVVCFGLLPPIARDGCVLRPETAAVLFGLLALLLLQCIPVVQRPVAARRSRGALTLALLATAALAIGFAVAALPTAGILLLLPGGASILAAAQVLLRLLRALRQRSIAVLPMQAAAARMWPWAVAAVVALFATLVVQQAAVRAPEVLSPSVGRAGLLPEAPWLRWPLLALAVLGGARMLLRTGQHLGRQGRLGADALLLLYCTVLLLQRWLRPADDDALPAALPLALLLAEGCIHATLLVARRR